MSIYQQQYGLSEVANATGVSAQTIKRWLHEERLLGAVEITGKITGGGGRGLRRAFPFFTVIEIGLAKAIMDRSPSDPKATMTAFHAARDFAHTSFSSTLERRERGMPFRDKLGTLICIAGTQILIVPRSPREDFYSGAWIELGRPDAMLLVEASRVFDRVARALGADPDDVLNQAYSEGPPQ